MSKRAQTGSAESDLYALYDRLDRLEELLEDMVEFGVTSVADAEQQIADLNERIDALESGETGPA